MTQELYTNSSSLTSILGGGQHGHIGLVMKPSLYVTISYTAYQPATDPGPAPVNVDGRSSTNTKEHIIKEFNAKKTNL